MKTLSTLLLMTALIFQTACSNTPLVLENSDHQNMQSANEGVVVNIQPEKTAADWKHTFAGAAIGVSIGQLIGNETSGVIGGLIGGNIANKKYGKNIEEITIEDSQGNRYQALVNISTYALQDQVLFKHDNGNVYLVSKN